MIQVYRQFSHIRWAVVLTTLVVTISMMSLSVRPLTAQVTAQDAISQSQAQTARSVAIAGPLSLASDQSLELVLALPVVPANQPNPAQFRLILQDAENGSVFGQKEIQVSGGIPGGGCLELTVDQGGHILIDDQPTNFTVQPGTRMAVVGVLMPLRLPGQARFIASLQLFDNATHRTVAALPAVQ